MGHFISNIHIKNFRSVVDQEFELNRFTPLVGLIPLKPSR